MKGNNLASDDKDSCNFITGLWSPPFPLFKGTEVPLKWLEKMLTTFIQGKRQFLVLVGDIGIEQQEGWGLIQGHDLQSDSSYTGTASSMELSYDV